MDNNLGKNNLSKAEILYYDRQLSLSELGLNGQKKLKSARVLVVGVGGLGVPVLQYLTAAGIGQMSMMDSDRVEIHNLHRQVLFGMTDVGRFKAEVAKEKLEKLNPYIRINAIPEKLTSKNALEIFVDYDLIVDCTDNFPTRYLINDACLMLNLPFIYGSIHSFEGQVSVFNVTKNENKRGPNYRDLFPEPPPPELIPNCSEAGVLGVLPGIIGCIQANEAIKLITAIGSLLSGKLLLFDALSMNTQIIKIPNINHSKSSIPNKLIDYESFCSIQSEWPVSNEFAEITFEEAKFLEDQNVQLQWVDVREPHEYKTANLGGILIPLGELPDRVDEISSEDSVVVYCQSGQRSAEAILYLKKNHDLTNIYNLKGGLIAALNVQTSADK